MSGTVPSLAANIEKPPGTPIDPADAERVKLFQQFQQRSVTLHNRLGVSPMCMYSSADGHLNDFHVLHCKWLHVALNRHAHSLCAHRWFFGFEGSRYRYH
jgi:hypothetical protein